MLIEQSMGQVHSRAPKLDGVKVNEPKRAPHEPIAWDLSAAVIRVLDVVFSIAGLIFIAPLMIVIAVLCYVQDPGPVFFAQSRRGSGGRMFNCFKFRSMVVDADARLSELLADDPAASAEWETSHKLRNDPRVTPWGRFLRQSSLDELPQLLNVIRGDMSLVGPRPIVVGEVHRYGRFIKQYDGVRPGVTGLWQISGRSSTLYRRRVALDVVFIRRRSIWLYLYILTATIPAVLLRRGAV